MNYSVVSPKVICNMCNHVQWAGADHCSACGISFVFGKPNAWESQAFTCNTTTPIIDADEELDLDIDKYFKELRDKTKKKRYKLVPIEEGEDD